MLRAPAQLLKQRRGGGRNQAAKIVQGMVRKVDGLPSRRRRSFERAPDKRTQRQRLKFRNKTHQQNKPDK